MRRVAPMRASQAKRSRNAQFVRLAALTFLLFQALVLQRQVMYRL